MTTKVLITGGAGFIGAHLAAELLAAGHEVRSLDDLNPQVHEAGRRPDYLPEDVELIVGDLRDPEVTRKALLDIDQVIHFAARVGVGQSMYEVAEYVSVNSVGTGVLLEALIENPMERLLVASSMSIYGEGLYRDREGNFLTNVERARADLEAGRWDPVAADGSPLEPVPTPESKPPTLSSIYALTKFDQEQMCLMFGRAYSTPVVALRFFNVYGPYQALSNPYTGVLAIFAARLLNDRPPLVFEDGLQRRDFVSVKDIARACRLALDKSGADGRIVNVGSGQSASVLDIAHKLAGVLNKEIEPEIVGKYRVGDIRNCFADIGLARELLGYEPQVSLEDGVAELAKWLEGQGAEDRIEAATKELQERGLTVGGAGGED